VIGPVSMKSAPNIVGRNVIDVLVTFLALKNFRVVIHVLDFVQNLVHHYVGFVTGRN